VVFFLGVSLQPVLLPLPPQRGRVYSESGCRIVKVLCGSQSLDDVLALQFLKRLVPPGFRNDILELLGEMLHLYLLTPGKERRPLHDILELTDIPLPPIRIQSLDYFR
jgi:hypothetical protein